MNKISKVRQTAAIVVLICAFTSAPSPDSWKRVREKISRMVKPTYLPAIYFGHDPEHLAWKATGAPAGIRDPGAMAEFVKEDK